MHLITFFAGLAFWYGSRQVIHGQVQGGDVLVVFLGVQLGIMSLVNVISNVRSIITAQVAAYKVKTLISYILF